MASSPGAGKEAIRPKRKRNLPGMPDPDAEVIALSPKSLMETNKYVCDICGKGFQRDQNLQLHRRGHNLPWKLKQRPAGNEVKKKVYVCPEPSCAHHDPTRALGDLTGIKKHFCRKHGEKKFKCDKCSKCYAVLCDWKAHSKICGTREYPCDCGTVFSRRDSFMTHRAFCDALAQESARSSHGEVLNLVNQKPPAPPSSSPPPQPPTPSTVVLSPVLSIQSSELPENQSGYSLLKKEPPPVSGRGGGGGGGGSSTSSGGGGNINWNTREGFLRMQETECVPPVKESSGNNNTEEASFVGLMGLSMPPSSMHSQPPPMMMSLSLSTTPFYPPANSASMFLYGDTRAHHFTPPPPPPAALSATALLQKAAEIGSKSSTTFLQGLGLAMSSVEEDYSPDAANPEKKPLLSSGLSLGLHSSSSPAAMIFGNKLPTLDFLGLGGNQTSSSSADQYPVLLSSLSNGRGRRDHFGMDASSSFTGILGGHSWDDTSDQNPAAGFL